MFNNIKIIRSYYKLAKIKFGYVFLLFLFLMIPAGLSIFTPIILSNVVTAVTVYDFKRAKMQIVFEFIILIVSAISYFIYHIINSKANKIIIFNFQNYIYENVRQNKNISGISLSTINNISACANFNKNLIYKLCFLIKSVIILCIIFYYNHILSFILLLVSLISFLLLNSNDKKIKIYSKQLSSYEQDSLNLFNSICRGKTIEENYNLQSSLKNKYFKYVDENVKTSNKISLFYNINNNFISLILKTTVFLSTLWLISSVQNIVITFSIYLILTPYLTTSAENLISFFEIFPEIALIDTNIKEFESLKYLESPKIEQNIEIKDYSLIFYNVTLKNKNTMILTNFNEKFNQNSIVSILSPFEKIDSIINLIKGKIKINSGSIFLDGKHIFDIDGSIYQSYFADISTDEKFFNVSIYENLFLVCQSRNKIFQTLNALNLKPIFNQLPDKIQTTFNNDFDQKTKFYLSVSRGVLSSAKILNIKNLPTNFSKTDYSFFCSLLKNLKKKYLIICFFQDQQINDISDKIIKIE